MNFDLTDDQQTLRATIRDFAAKELNDDLLDNDRDCIFPRDAWRKCATMGIPALPVPEEHGGSGADMLSVMLALEALGYACRDNGLIFALNAHMWAVQAPVLRFGSVAQKASMLPRLVSGEWIGAHGMTEPGSGSDSFALSTTAVKRGDRYVLNGTKTFVSNAPVADLFLIFASTSKARGFMGLTAFLVEKGTKGLSAPKAIEKMGLRTAPLGEVVLDDCEVPVENRLGGEGNGGTIFKHSMGWERACILASYIGTMERQLEQSVEYARTRQQFSQPIGKFQSVSNRLVDMKLRLETARLLLYRVGWMHTQGRDTMQEAALAKLYVSECAVQSSLDAIQVHGGYGYTTEYQFERELRDAIGSRIYSGTSEIQREIIARSMGL